MDVQSSFSFEGNPQAHGVGLADGTLTLRLPCLVWSKDSLITVARSALSLARGSCCVHLEGGQPQICEIQSQHDKTWTGLR